MNFEFATCERSRALDFIREVYPSRNLIDTPGTKLSALLDLVERDIVRIQDPSMHGKLIAVSPGRNWDESLRESASRTAREFHEEILASSDHDATAGPDKTG